MNAYRSRTKTAIESYRIWRDNPGSSEWKPKSGTQRVSKNGEPKIANRSVKAPASEGTSEASAPTYQVNTGHVPARAPLIEYPFPLRPGIRARIALPEDLTEKEAKRLARFVESLAFSEQRAITARPTPE